LKAAAISQTSLIDRCIPRTVGSFKGTEWQQPELYQKVARIAQPAEKLTLDQWINRIIPSLLSRSHDEMMNLLGEGQRQGFLTQTLPGPCGGSFLHAMAKIGKHKECLPAVMSCGIDLAMRDTIYGNTGLMWAIANANNGMALEMIKLGGEGAYLNVQCNQGNSALHLAVGKGYKDIDSDNKQLECSNLDLVNNLILKKCNVNLQNDAGNTPLHLACLRRDSAMIQSLLKAGANTMLKNREGQLPIELLEWDYDSAQHKLWETIVAFRLDKHEHAESLEKTRLAFLNFQSHS
jgi:ankyrin repeat protein